MSTVGENISSSELKTAPPSSLPPSSNNVNETASTVTPANAPLLSDSELSALASVPILDEEGKEVLFGSLYRDKKTIIIFVRHFLCGMCKLYMEALAEVRQEALEASGVNMIFVGCGEVRYIKAYREETGFKGAGYTDSTARIYKQLGFGSNLNMGPSGDKKKSYLKGSMLKNNLVSLGKALKSPVNSVLQKSGNVVQLGGEFVLGPGDTCSFAYRMRNTQDHTEVADLMRAAGVEFP